MKRNREQIYNQAFTSIRDYCMIIEELPKDRAIRIGHLKAVHYTDKLFYQYPIKWLNKDDEISLSYLQNKE